MRILAIPLTLILSVFLLGIVLFPQAPPVQAADDHGDDRDHATAINTTGTRVHGSISPTILNNGFDRDYFSFRAMRGVRYTITAHLQTVERVDLSIINSKRLGTGEAGDQSEPVLTKGEKIEMEWTARTQDTYFVEVKAHYDAGGDPLLGAYSLSITADNSLADSHHGDSINYAYPAETGKPYQAAISPWSNRHFGTGTIYGRNDQDFFAFDAERGGKYTVEVQLGTSEGVDISVVDDFGQKVHSTRTGDTTLEWVAPDNDIYYARITGTGRVKNTVGTYTVTIDSDDSLIDRHSDKRTNAEVIAIGQTHQGAVSPADDLDYFSFQANRGVKYTIDLIPGTTEAVDVVIEKPSQGIEASHVGDGASLNWVAPNDNTYYLVISRSSQVRGAVGSYTLRITSDNSLRDQDDDTTGTATPLLLGAAIAGAISPADDRDYFSFTAIKGVKYTAEVQLGDDQTMEITVTNSQGGVVDANKGRDSTIEWVSPANGEYFIVLSGSNRASDVTGQYTIRLLSDMSLRDQHSDTRDGATPVIFGNTMLAAISPGGDQDYYSFSARKGVKYDFLATAGTIDGVYIKIVGASQGIEAVSDGESESMSWTSPDNGSYYVVVSSAVLLQDAVGTYSLRIDADLAREDRHKDTWSNATPIGSAKNVSGAVSPATDRDYFSFTADKGAKYTFTASEDSAKALSLAVEEADNNRSRVLASNYSEGSKVSWIAPEPGSYYFVVSTSSRAADAGGTYSIGIDYDLSLEDKHSDTYYSATNIGFNNPFSAAISPAEDLDYFTFPAVLNQDYTIQVTLGTADAVRFSVINQSTGLGDSNYGEGTTLHWTAPATGNYHIVATAADQAEDPVGTYQITLMRGTVAAPDVTETTVEAETNPDESAVETKTPGTDGNSGTGGNAPTGAALVVESRIAVPGAQVLTPIRLENPGEVHALRFNLNYDPSVLELIDVQPGSRLSVPASNYDTNTPGVVSFSLTVSGQLDGDGSAALIAFKVVGEAGASSHLTITETMAADSSGNTQSIEWTDGAFTVETPSAGDGNGDGKITALDALIALRMSAGIAKVDLLMDVNGDGRVTPRDARQLLSMASQG